MVSLTKIENNYEKKDGVYKTVELRGLSTDEKPTEVGESKVDNGSVFIEIDTGKLYLYDLENQLWKEV